MVKVPHTLQGPWSNIGYLLLAHILQRSPKNECLDMTWVAKVLDITEPQLRTMLHRENKYVKVWFPEMLNRLRELGYPEMVLFEQQGNMHYTIAIPLDYKTEIVMKNDGMSWVTKNGR